MKFKSLIIATALVAASSFASAVTMVPAIALTQTSTNTYSGEFSGSANTNTFSLDLSSLPAGVITFSSLLSASFTGLGYDVTGATFDGVTFTPVVNFSAPGILGADLWQFSASNISNTAAHTLVITGNAIGGSTVGFTGNLSVSNTPFPTVTPVPEPETYAMLLAGLGLMGAIARRRNQSKSV